MFAWQLNARWRGRASKLTWWEPWSRWGTAAGAADFKYQTPTVGPFRLPRIQGRWLKPIQAQVIELAGRLDVREKEVTVLRGVIAEFTSQRVNEAWVAGAAIGAVCGAIVTGVVFLLMGSL